MLTTRPKWQLELANYILDNLFDFLTIAAAAYVVIRSQFRPYGAEDMAQLATWILGILGLLAVSGLWERHRQLRNIQEVNLRTNEIVTRRLTGQASASEFFWPSERKIARQDLARANEIYVVGMVLNRTVREHLTTFGDRVADGAHLKFILLDPDNEAIMKIMPFRSYGTKAGEWWCDRIRQTIGHIEDIPDVKKPKGTIQVGLLPYFPSFGMWLIDPDQPHGQIVVEIYHHRTAEPNPTFLLKASEDSYWYQLFRNQFVRMWESCVSTGKLIDVAAPEVSAQQAP